MQADLVLYNGRIYTMDRASPQVQAVGIAGSRIASVGDDDQIKDLLIPGGEAIDLGGRTVLPGLTDCHVHFVGYALRLTRIDLAGVDWMNSTGLGILISGLTTLRNNKGELKLANVTDKIQSLLAITRLITVFETHDSIAEALNSFNGHESVPFQSLHRFHNLIDGGTEGNQNSTSFQG